MTLASTDPRDLCGLMSTNSPIDPERLAALMDGRLSASEAAKVRAELAASDADEIEAFAAASAIAAELGISAPPHIAEHPSKPKRFYMIWSAVGLAAAAALVFAAINLTNRNTQTFNADALVADLPPSVTAPVTEAWVARRGAGDDMLPRIRAARLGSTLVDLELAARGRDSVAMRRIASALVTLADPIPGATPLLSPYRVLASGGELPTPQARQEIANALAALAGREWAVSGAAGETLRAAAESHDASTIAQLCNQSRDLRRSLSASISAPGAEIRDSLTRVLDQRPCPTERVGQLSVAFLSFLTQ